MVSLWTEVAKEGEFDPGNAGIQRLWLEYSGSGVLLSASVQAFTYDFKFLQVGFMNYALPDEDLVFISGGISPVTSLAPHPLVGAAGVFRAIDTVNPARMIAVIGDSGVRHALTVRTSAVPTHAAAYLWDGVKFTSLAPADSRRAYSTDAVYLEVFSAVGVSLPRDSSTETSQYQESGTPIYFVVPNASS